jgi:hypothetical protein
MGLYTREDDVIRDSVTRLKQATPDAAAPPAKRPKRAKPDGKATKNPLTIEELHQQMVRVLKIIDAPWFRIIDVTGAL